jgi:hypothetical protein
MKKTLLVISLVASSCFFTYALQIGNTQVNVGRVCGTLQGKPACINPSTGQYELSTGNGGGVSGNVNTGKFGMSGTIGGVRVGFGDGYSSFMQGNGLLGLLALAQEILRRLVPFLVGLAIVVFFWYLINFMWVAKDDPTLKNTSLKGMGYAILAIFVMVSIWGLIGFLGNVLGIGQGGQMPEYRLPGQ